VIQNSKEVPDRKKEFPLILPLNQKKTRKLTVVNEQKAYRRRKYN